MTGARLLLKAECLQLSGSFKYRGALNAVLAGLDAGDEIILPDPAARAAWDLKRTNRTDYDAQMRHQAERLDRLP
jgi:threonine dehydratase